MKPVRAEFRPASPPGRRAVIAVVLLALAASAALGSAQWQRLQARALRAHLVDLEDERRSGRLQPPPRPPAVYAESAEAFLREREAAWASMLRSLENAAMVGVTPTLVDFDALDGSARVDLAYTDPAALFDYIGRLNEGLPPSETLGRWSLVQLHVTPAVNGTAAVGVPVAPNVSTMGSGPATASIRSDWKLAGSGAPPRR